MPNRLTDAQLEQFMLDPREPCHVATCPYCGSIVVLGVRKVSEGKGNACLAHEAVQDPLDPTHTKYTSGCAPFAEMTSGTGGAVSFLRACKVRGIHWEKFVQ